MFRSICLIIVLLVPSLSVASHNGKRVIAFAQDTMANDFRKAQVFEVRDEALKHPGISFVYSDGQGQTSLMIHQIEQFISQKVDLLIVGTNNETAVVPVISKAYKLGIPVILLDRGIKSKDYTTFITSDNEKIGKMGAKYIIEKINGKGKVLLFEGIQEADVTKLRTKGFIDEVSKHKGIQVIKRTGNFLRKDAIVEMEKLMKQGVHLDAIFSESDSMLSGVRMVLNRYKVDPSSMVMVGVDYISEAQEAIRKGTQNATIVFPLGGVAAVENASKIFNGESVPKKIYNPIKLVTKKNVEIVKPIF